MLKIIEVGLGEVSVGKVFVTQTYGSEFRSPEPTQSPKQRCADGDVHCAHNSSPPAVRWEGKTGESLNAKAPATLVGAIAKKLSQTRQKKKTYARSCPLTCKHTPYHVTKRTHTNTTFTYAHSHKGQNSFFS